MVCIHEGIAFNNCNTFEKYRRDYLVNKDVIDVSVILRLSVLGKINLRLEIQF
jgi:hypothetical protein